MLRTSIPLSICLLLSICLSPTLAAKGENHPNRPLESLQYCLKQLDLSTDQQTKVDDLMADFQSKAASLKKSAKGSGDKKEAREDIREKYKAMFEDLHSQLQKVLTSDQAEKLKTLLAKERADRKEDAADRKGHRAATTEPAP
ncbi:MAG TPA: hypothetical protein VFE58_12440 [Tepidisphaeraceae bacterium]|jgi:Spy/CpxP family protein refolding chaperone|nr:hypothetical protein [Tepidisphaeraceae bacterium]